MRKVLIAFVLLVSVTSMNEFRQVKISIFFMNHFDGDSVKVFFSPNKVVEIKLKTNESTGSCDKGIGLNRSKESIVVFENVSKKVIDSISLKNGYGYLYVYFLNNKFVYRFEKNILQLE